VLGAVEVAGYVLLWVFPQLGAFILTAVMVGGWAPPLFSPPRLLFAVEDTSKTHPIDDDGAV
jgi:hypothetical protein